MKTLVLWLQKSSSEADVSQLATVVDHVVKKLRYLVTRDPEEKHRFSEAELVNLKFNRDFFNLKLDVIKNFVESLPAASRLRSNSQVIHDPFENFENSVFKPFIVEVADEIEREIKVDPVTQAFQCLDVRRFPKSKEHLKHFGEDDLQILTVHFGEPQEARNPSTLINNRADPKIDKNTTKQEYKMFKEVAYEINVKRTLKLEQNLEKLSKKVKTTLQTKQNKSKIDKLNKDIELLHSQIDDMALSEVMSNMSEAHRLLFPNIIVLLELAIICPVSNATVERLFSFLKLVKTKLRNQLSDEKLDKILRIKTESPEHLEDEELEALVDNFKDHARDMTKTGEIRIQI